MIEFFAGIIVGMLSGLILLVLFCFFKKPLEQAFLATERSISRIAPRQKGFIVEPESEADEKRKEIIEQNRREGRDTRVSDLT